ncbi:MAG TPA: DHA2 family efflux MFS transporter permease subunit [Candidatus Paceibacterota bacterium]|nr:DHA2 family efflux MFS transporter permease subunit [Candidatus Paceibacterota bacterium]
MDAERATDRSLRWMVLLTVMVGTFLGRLDQTIVNLALPKMIDDFGITVSAAGWIATAYILANAVFVPVWGKLGDSIGRKKVYIIGFIVFIIGSVLAGLAWNLPSMIVFRVIQAIAGSADYPTAMAILAVTFAHGKERAQALGIWSASFAAASVFGPLLGGPLIDSFGWRSVFLINLPVGLVGLFMAFRYVHESRSEQKKEAFDWWGAITLGVALAALVLVLDQGSTWGWLSWQSLVSYAVAAVFSIVFYVLEHRHEAPIVDFKFFKSPIFNSALINNFVVFMGMMGSIFLIPIFSQTFLGYDATQSGMLFIPMAFCMVIAAALGGRTIGKVSTRTVIFVSTLGAAVGLFLFSYIDPRSTAIDIILPLSVMAFFMGAGMSQRTNMIAEAVPKNEIGVASSILALVRNISGAFGIAIFGTLLNNLVESNVLSIAQSSSIHSTSPAIIGEATSLIILKAQVSAYGTVFFVSSLVVFFGAILVLFTKFPKYRQPKPGEERVEVMVE